MCKQLKEMLPYYGLNIDRSVCHVTRYICDRLWINHPSTAKCKFWLRPKITARSARGRYPVNAIGVIYGVLATLCRSTKRRLHYSFSRSDATASVDG